MRTFRGLPARPIIIAFAAAAAFVPAVLPASAQASTVAAGAARGTLVEASGGMSSVSAKVAAVPAAATPSCHAITYRGNAGAIHVQTSKNGTVAWGIYMYNSKLNAGPWVVNVYVGKRRVDGKKQNYAPHGSVDPKDAKKGAIFHITATHHATANGKNYVNVPNECVIP
jgi:hypothetical protein